MRARYTRDRLFNRERADGGSRARARARFTPYCVDPEINDAKCWNGRKRGSPRARNPQGTPPGYLTGDNYAENISRVSTFRATCTRLMERRRTRCVRKEFATNLACIYHPVLGPKRARTFRVTTTVIRRRSRCSPIDDDL